MDRNFNHGIYGKISAGTAFRLTDLVSYRKNGVVNQVIAQNDGMTLILMAMDQGVGLPEHQAPGMAILTALEGEATIVYEGKAHRIAAGESFHFVKGAKHSVSALKPFKMSLLILSKE
ncbi:MAG: cupin domain-containing protein [Pyramidobacter sp.]|jgi:quercetin dioxygenase-like cupin family protein